MKKFLGLLLVFAVVLSIGGSVFAAWPDQYADVDSWPEWALKGQRINESKYEAWGGDLAEAVWWELMIGDPPANGEQSSRRTFRPSDTITRAEYATILVRALGITATQGSGEWYRPAVNALMERNIVTSDGDFNLAITRREMGDWVGRSLDWYGVDLTGKSETSFSDIAALPEAPYISVASKAGVIRGYPDGTFGPERTATRAEAAAMAIRLAKQLTKNKPGAEEFGIVYREFWKAITRVDKEMTSGETYNHGSYLAPLTSQMYLYGPDGLDSYYRWFFDQRHYPDSYRELVDVVVTPFQIRDTVALVQVTATTRRVRFDGQETYRNTATEFVYLVRRGPEPSGEGGRWVISNVEAPSNFPDSWKPQAEEGR
ncbi:MAG TPA: S-layer homology domain-containing protein [Symbiobacteriaceae bacterium]|nr:S-layer homology domain-containing protein [Symbiobacteriaceae bacterium]